MSGFSFSVALQHLKDGKRVSRLGWKGMFAFLVNGSRFEVNRAPLNVIYPEGTMIDYGAHIDIRAADGSIRPWVASQSDLLEEDWVVADPVEDFLEVNETPAVPIQNWSKNLRDDKVIVKAKCPSCGVKASLEDHTIAEDGLVSPSMQCNCGFHDTGRLVGWMG